MSCQSHVVRQCKKPLEVASLSGHFKKRGHVTPMRCGEGPRCRRCLRSASNVGLRQYLAYCVHICAMGTCSWKVASGQTHVRYRDHVALQFLQYPFTRARC